MLQSQLSHSIMDQIKDAGYQCWIQIYSPLFWILSVLINHWRLQENNKIIIDDNFSCRNIMPPQKKTVKISNNLPPPPPRIVISPSSLRQQQQNPSNKQLPVRVQPVSKKKPAALLLQPKPKSSLSTPTSTSTTTKKQSSIFSSWKQKHSHQQRSPRTSFLRRLSNGSTSSGDTIKSEPSSPSILKSFSWKPKRHYSDSSLETGHPNPNTSAINSSKQPRISLSHFRKKTTI
ncbi:hypothetical protein [Parasitella parasitica]|uniref:Uncharacterized protein n=1 Tax=Parasitella parasitica TaxID=35722 RepID=A0A0B7N5Q6_9FUNG|nr:hypothetical protein [Parasitella parasitica]